MPQQQRAFQTRRNVLVGAAIAIDRRGYGAATIAEIVRESRITKGALYFHFPSKEAVAEAIIAEQGEWLKARRNDDHEPVQAMLDLSYAFVDAVVSDPLMRASIRMTIDRAGPAASITQGYTNWIAAVTDLLDRARAAGTLHEGVEPDGCAYVITSAMTGLQLTSDALSQRRDLTERVESFWRMVLPALLRPELLGTVDVRPPERRTGTVVAAV